MRMYVSDVDTSSRRPVISDGSAGSPGASSDWPASTGAGPSSSSDPASDAPLLSNSLIGGESNTVGLPAPPAASPPARAKKKVLGNDLLSHEIALAVPSA